MWYDVVGSGDGVIFQDGQAIEVTWEKEDEESMIRFYDQSSKEIEFVRGKIWVSVIPTGNKINYSENN